MATLKDIKARIGTVANIKKITKAMQLVAAAKLNKAQERALTVRPYASELDGILGALAAASGSDESSEATVEMDFFEDAPPLRATRARLFEQKDIRKPGIVLFTSDRGLCGAFNTNLIRHAQSVIRGYAGRECKLITIGRKGHAFFKRNPVEIVFHREGINDRLPLNEIKELTGRLVSMFLEDEVDALYLIYAKPKGAAAYTIVDQQFLCIPPIKTDDLQTEENFIFEPNRDDLFATLIPLYATTTIFSALADSYASEYGAKMAAMQQATKNAEETLDDLIILRNRLRQATITRELAEIVGGAEALK